MNSLIAIKFCVYRFHKTFNKYRHPSVKGRSTASETLGKFNYGVPFFQIQQKLEGNDHKNKAAPMLIYRPKNA